MNRHAARAIVIALLSTPPALAVVEAVSYYARNRSTHAIVSSGETREYTLYVPPTLDLATPAPLVISIHGAAMWPAAQQDVSQWNRVADREGFIVAYPAGRSGRGPRITGPQDVAFIGDMIDAIGRSHRLDPSRIYANGLSNGGGTSFVLSCMMADRIAAVGLVAAALLQPWEWCADTRPVPMIAFHGTRDDWTPYDGGYSPGVLRTFPSIRRWTQLWAARNRCALQPVETRVAHDVSRLEYIQCAGDAAATLYTIHDGGHTWPGGGYIPEWFAGRTSHSVDASALMWEFFQAHPLRK
jgi:polyhydroxybutyrate depolymerase